MGKRISRKDFFEKSLAGLAGISLIPGHTYENNTLHANMRDLGKTGIKVCPLCFGAPRTNDESLIRYAIEKGMNFIDTGRAYGNGNNEKLVGRAINGIRKNIIIQSKIRLELAELPSNGKGKKGYAEIREVLSAKLEASLKALGTDYIDIMLIHDARNEDLLFHPEVMRFFSEAKKAGTIKAHGFSSHNDYLNIPARNNKENFYDVIMTPFNHKGSFIHSQSGTYSEWDQNKLTGILSEAGSKGIAVVSMKTCSGGPYSPAHGSQASFREAVRWVLGHDFVSSVAVAMSNFEQVNEHTSWLAPS
jgi:aryl-alcohol dehydrogenase-like predicted oxidoreductase